MEIFNSTLFWSHLDSLDAYRDPAVDVVPKAPGKAPVSDIRFSKSVWVKIKTELSGKLISTK